MIAHLLFIKQLHIYLFQYNTVSLMHHHIPTILINCKIMHFRFNSNCVLFFYITTNSQTVQELFSGIKKRIRNKRFALCNDALSQCLKQNRAEKKPQHRFHTTRSVTGTAIFSSDRIKRLWVIEPWEKNVHHCVNANRLSMMMHLVLSHLLAAFTAPVNGIIVSDREIPRLRDDHGCDDVERVVRSSDIREMTASSPYRMVTILWRILWMIRCRWFHVRFVERSRKILMQITNLIRYNVFNGIEFLYALLIASRLAFLRFRLPPPEIGANCEQWTRQWPYNNNSRNAAVMNNCETSQ